MRLITEDNRPDLVELLQKLQEECAEVIQASSKIIRFGMIGQNPTSDKSNVKQLSFELTDVLAIIKLLTNEPNFAISYNDINNTEKSIEKFRNYSVYWKAND
jgi:NTP pyrophosphatase (non-canonical NTP hydrolase)